MALNILAHIDADEAQAELVSRISHANERKPLGGERKSKAAKEMAPRLGRAIARERFDPFSSEASDLPFE